MKAVLPRQHQGEKRSSRKAAFDRAGRRRRLDDARALRAALLRADVPSHREGHRLDVQHFRFVRLTEILHLAAAVRASTLGRCNHVINVLKMLGQLFTADRLAFGNLLGFESGVGMLGLGYRGPQFLEGQGQLPAVHLFGGLAEPRTAQLCQLELQVFDLLIALAQLNIFRLRGGVMLEDEALKSRYIIWQSVNIEHADIIPAASERCAAFCLYS